ncbi:MAG: hypothetical protein HEQ17_01720 [Limnohabitans sp.]|uniref:hypothetical protein n=1 Tax=Limnohabitans sp. TaxID=1907725 RepID=UPI0025F8142E|nr:hypothetical protein [Limnohabitans sp.]MCO4087709.1 hypothetical protein [Limnohabitans sp.]
MSNVKLETLSAGKKTLSSGGVDFEVTAFSASEVEAVSARTGNYMYARAADRVFAMAKDLNNNGKLDSGDSVIYSFGDPHFNQVTLTGNEGSSLKDIVAFCGYATDFDVQSNYILHTKDAQALVDTEVLSETYTMNDKITWEVAGENGRKGAISLDFNADGGIDLGTGQLVTQQSLAADASGDATVDLFYDPDRSGLVFTKAADGRKAAIEDGAFINRAGQEINKKLVLAAKGEFQESRGAYFGVGNHEGAVVEPATNEKAKNKVNMQLEVSQFNKEDPDEDEEAQEEAFQLNLSLSSNKSKAT